MKFRLAMLVLVFTLCLCSCGTNETPLVNSTSMEAADNMPEADSVEWTYFPAETGVGGVMPMPDSCMPAISYHSFENNGTAQIYTFILPQDSDSANETYHEYQRLLAEECGLEMDNRDDMLYIFKDGELVSLMMAGTDPKLGLFVQISFPT